MRTPDNSVLAGMIICCVAAVSCGGSSAEREAIDDAGSALPDAAQPEDTSGGPPTDATLAAAATTRATITFRFRNTGTETLYVYQDCVFALQVTSLADGTSYGIAFTCACDCSDSKCTGGVACGACRPPSGVPFAVGQVTDIFWMAETSTLQSKTGPYGPFQCVDLRPIPTGLYKVTLAVYANEADTTAKTNGRVVEMPFTLGTEDAVVEVPVD
jgi:hypothetical protein